MQLVRQYPTHSFKDVRQAAIEWEKRGAPTSTQRARAYSCDSHASAVCQDSADASAITARSGDELGELKECLRQQQAQLDAILKRLGTPSTTLNPIGRQDFPRGSRQKPYRFQPDGKPICIRCNTAGHIARFCRVEMGGPTLGVEPRGQGQKVGAQVNAVEQQEN